MKLFLDTAKIEEIREAVSWGVISGVTTNPSLMKLAGTIDLKKVSIEICELVQGPVSAEVVSVDTEGMLREASDIVTWHEHIVIKIPTTENGLKAINQIRHWWVDIDGNLHTGPDDDPFTSDKQLAWNAHVNATLVFSAAQGLLAALAGASYVSPFVGRLDDGGLDGMEIVSELVNIFDNYAIGTEVIAASLRHPQHVIQAALERADIATLPFSVLKKMISHPYTEVGLKRFLDDWSQAGGK
ncbi:MAG: fructose-6-phosphate aldolase [Anaerolineales bacterium]|nr:fructose-6-phosphate aldolase [Anaerolineales bacterium]